MSAGSTGSAGRFPRGVVGAYVIAIVALVLAMTTGAYAAVRLGQGVVHTRNIAGGAVTGPKLAVGAVTGPKLAVGAVTGKTVRDHALRLRDLGGPINTDTRVSTEDLTIPTNQCRQVFLTLADPATKAIVGSLVVTYLTANDGGPVLDNAGFLVPTVVSTTLQGGAVVNALVCAGTGPGETVPTGSVYHYTVIGQ